MFGEIGAAHRDEDVDDVFARLARHGGAADVGDGAVGDGGAGEVGGELGLDGEEGGGPGGLVFVDPDVHGAVGWLWMGVG